MGLEDVGVVVGIVIGIIGVLGLLGYAARGSILKTTNEVLEKALTTERQERAASETRCATEVAELRGKVTTLTRDHAKTVAHEVIRVFRDEGVLPPRGG